MWKRKVLGSENGFRVELSGPLHQQETAKLLTECSIAAVVYPLLNQVKSWWNMESCAPTAAYTGGPRSMTELSR